MRARTTARPRRDRDRPRPGSPGRAAALALLAALVPAGLAHALDGGQASLGGTTGYWNTPSAEVTPDAAFRLGYHFIDREMSYEARGFRDNEVYFFTAGFLPFLEISIRATVIPGEHLLEEVKTSAADRMGSARLRVLREGRFPAVALGIDDFKGTKRFHSLYAVATKGCRPGGGPIDVEASAGYGSHAMKAARHILDGGFGGLEIRAFRAVSGVVEYDTEKWNAGARVVLFRKLALSGVYLDLDVLSGGASFTQRF
jgi:hypothetical protein